MTEAQKTDQYGPVVARLESASKPGKEYEVRFKDEAWSCQCSSWRFRKTCRHVEYCRDMGITSPDLEDALEATLLKALRPGGACSRFVGEVTSLKDYVRAIAAVVRSVATVRPEATKQTQGGIRKIILDD